MEEEITEQSKPLMASYVLPVFSFGLIVSYFIFMANIVGLLLPENVDEASTKAKEFAMFGGVAINAIICSLAFGFLLTRMRFKWSKKVSIGQRFAGVIYGFLACIALSMLLKALYMVFNYEPELQQVAESIKNLHPEYLYLVVLGPMFFVPLVEEILFRGFLYRSIVAYFQKDVIGEGENYSAIKEKWVKILSMLVTSAVFALVHRELPAMPQLFFLGFIFNYAYEKTGSLAVAVSLHAINNCLSIVALFFI
ncbi:MAG: CPBP family intramembrane metalloprotease [Lentisphaeraceae bacterium]|nr:CPBP family intramembrane metalloprotease [Lentisphaeraceae bacterium]